MVNAGRRAFTFASTAALVLAGASIVRATPISSGLILNFQADNIDGANNSTLTNGQEITSWLDVAVGTDNTLANNATEAGGDAFGANASQGTPNFIAGPVPAIQFTKTSSTVGDALGFFGAIGIGTGAVDFTGFVVGDFTNSPAAIMRMLQFGDKEASATPDKKIVGLADNGYRFNGGSHLFAENLQSAGTHVASYVMQTTDKFGDTRFRFDGAEGSETSNPVAAADVIALDDEGFAMGVGFNGTGGNVDIVNGKVHAILLYDRVLSAAEIAQVESYLTEKFAVPEPSSLAFLVCGGALALRRRRR